MSFYHQVKKWWKKYSPWLILILVIILFIYLIVSGEKHDNPNGGYAGIVSLTSLDQIFRKKKRQLKKNETKCRKIFEEIFQAKFPSIRPDFLKYPKTGKNLELDGYNRRLNLAFEYNGKQHYEYEKYFHKSYSDFEEQQQRDNYKMKRCQELGIEVIVIPYTIPYGKLNQYITQELTKKGLLPDSPPAQTPINFSHYY